VSDSYQRPARASLGVCERAGHELSGRNLKPVRGRNGAPRWVCRACRNEDTRRSYVRRAHGIYLTPDTEEQLVSDRNLPPRPIPNPADEYARLRTLGLRPGHARYLAVKACQTRIALGSVGRPREPREHGSEKGWRQHRTDGTVPCPPCLAAHSRHNLGQQRTAA